MKKFTHVSSSCIRDIACALLRFITKEREREIYLSSSLGRSLERVPFFIPKIVKRLIWTNLNLRLNLLDPQATCQHNVYVRNVNVYTNRSLYSTHPSTNTHAHKHPNTTTPPSSPRPPFLHVNKQIRFNPVKRTLPAT